MTAAMPRSRDDLVLADVLASLPPAVPTHAPAPGLTLADVLAALSAAGDLNPRRRQDMASAVRTVARLLGEDAARLPANRRALARRLADIAPAVTCPPRIGPPVM